MRPRQFVTGVIVGLALLCTPSLAMAQGTSGVPGITPANVPIVASGQMPSAVPTEEQVPDNVLTGKISVGATYDDNAVPIVKPREWDVVYSVFPEISIQERRDRITWSLSYTPGFDFSQELLYRNQFAQKFTGDVAWRTSPHGTLSAQEYYLVTTNPFAGFAGSQPGPTIGPNETIYIPNVRQTLTLSHAMYSYEASAQTSMGLGGTFELQKYDNTPHSGPTTAFIHTQIASGDGYISHRFTARNQLGLQYSAQVMRFPQANAHTTTHTFQLFEQLNLSSSTSVSLYGGPEYSLTSNQVIVNLGFIILSIPVHANQWSASGGLIYNWTGSRLAAAVDFSRRVSDGGGLFGAVELTQGRAQLVWQLTKGWSLTSSIDGADDQLLGTHNGSNELKTYSGQAGIRRTIGRSAAMNFFYRRLNETGAIQGISLGNRDLVGVTLEYSFLKPLGG